MGGVDYKINWHGDGTGIAESGKLIIQDRIHYFSMLRMLIAELRNLGKDEVDDVLEKYNVHFVDIDDIKRVNIDEPI